MMPVKLVSKASCAGFWSAMPERTGWISRPEPDPRPDVMDFFPALSPCSFSARFSRPEPDWTVWWLGPGRVVVPSSGWLPFLPRLPASRDEASMMFYVLNTHTKLKTKKRKKKKKGGGGVEEGFVLDWSLKRVSLAR